ncbi:hypothetical protein ACH5RR_022421 [Cinchona calisaya]|uniref:ABC transporter domain-containing protein n=1 Tax=Cinchona calisaya TaxID=153742 RepID=A0ABD2Z7S3_9GENT
MIMLEFETIDSVACNVAGGVYSTWKDIRLTVSNGRYGRKAILQGLTGYASPGQILAIMGPSDSGKSTLLDALAAVVNCLSILHAYVTDNDILTWTLTVREAVYYSAQLQLPNAMSLAEKRERAERTIREMGLQNCFDTRIGGWGLKGLGNGQKRRVSICMEILTRSKLLFLDEPTSGLDSAASNYILDRIMKLARRYGRTIYFGPTTAANQFFAMNGFPCPSLQSPADHYLRMINPDFSEDIESSAGGKIATREAIDIVVQSYRTSEVYKRTLTQAAEIHRQVFQRERLSGYYGVAAFVVSNTISSLPFLLLISMIPGAITYYLVGLQQGSERFLYFIMILITCLTVVERLMMIVATLVPNFLMGLITGAGLHGLMMLSVGCFRLPNHLPNIFWNIQCITSPFTSMHIKDYTRTNLKGWLAFPKNLLAGGSSDLVDGETILKDIWQVEMRYSK